jgi:predicted nucleotidyltransferase
MQNKFQTINSKDELFDLLRRHEADISEFGVKKIGVFGSFIRNNVKENSDVDIFLEMDPNKKT